MAISGGTLAAILGALGVGGFLWWQKAKTAAGASPCQKLVATAATAGGYPTADALTKSICNGVDSILDGGLAGVSKLPGVQVATTVLGTVTHAIFGSGPTCPAGSKTIPWSVVIRDRRLSADLIVRDFGIASTVRGKHIYTLCIDANASSKTFTGKDIKGIFYTDGKTTDYVPYVNWSSTAPPSGVKPVALPSGVTGTSGATRTPGRTAGGTSVS